MKLTAQKTLIALGPPEGTTYQINNQQIGASGYVRGRRHMGPIPPGRYSVYNPVGGSATRTQQGQTILVPADQTRDAGYDGSYYYIPTHTLSEIPVISSRQAFMGFMEGGPSPVEGFTFEKLGEADGDRGRGTRYKHDDIRKGEVEPGQFKAYLKGWKRGFGKRVERNR